MNSTPLTIESITNDLTKLGISQGDTLMIKADLVKIGFIKESPKTGVLEALKKYLRQLELPEYAEKCP